MKSVSELKVQVFADGADKASMLELYRQPYIKGFTTNPTLMRKAGVTDYERFAREILQQIPDRPISFEVFADDAHVGDFGGVAAIPTDNAQDFRADGFCILQGSHQIRADIFFEIATTDGEHEYEIVRAQATHAKPSLEHSCPTFIVGSRREFRHIVGRGVSLDARDFSKIVHGMGSVGCAASDAKDE